MAGKKSKIDSVEKEKRIRAVQEWIIDEWPSVDIIKQINQMWGVEERQAKRYISEAKERWMQDADKIMERKRVLKVEGLKKLKRSLTEKWKGTPAGINAIVRVEKEIIKLEGLRAPEKIEIDHGIKDLEDLPVVFE